MSRALATCVLAAALAPAHASGAAQLQLYVMPDTQSWAWNQGGTTLETWRSVAKALCARRERFAMVLHTGDLVDEPGKRPAEWANARSVLKQLDACGMPLAIAFGNHDFDGYPAATGDRGWRQVVSQLAQRPAETGPSGRSALHPLADGWFVISADLMPSREDLDWIAAEIAKRKDARFVLLNHLCADARGLFAGLAPDWCRPLVSQQPRIRLVVSGHWLGARRDGWHEVPRPGGPPLLALYQNYQHVPELAAWGVVIELDTDSGAACVWSENLLTGATQHPDARSDLVGWVGPSPPRTCFGSGGGARAR